MSDYRTLEKKWLTCNPLRQWRLEHKLFLKDMGAALGVGFHTVFQWETGMTFPNSERMDALIKLTNNKKLAEEFQIWKEDRPILGRE